jgi:two-component system, sensor histidine kinase LadS
MRKRFFIFIVLLQLKAIASIKTSYYHDANQKVNISEFSNLRFQPFESKVNRGLQNGVYWIKVENDDEDNFIEVSSARIRNVRGFIHGDEVKQSLDFPMCTFGVSANETLYLRVLCTKEANIPIVAHSKSGQIKAVQKQFLYYGLYYGFAIVIVTLNLFYFFNFKENTFLYYALFLVGIIFTILFRDALVPLLFSNKWLIVDGEVLFHFVTVSFGILFASVYLRHEIHFPKLKYYSITITLISFFFFSSFVFTGHFIWFAMAQFSGITLLIIYWISSLLLFTKNTFYAFFAIAYSLILVLAIDFFILPILGLPNLGITTGLMKIASVFEMLILSYAVVYRMRILQKENTDMHASLYQRTNHIEKLEDELLKLKQGEKNKITNANLNGREVEILTMIANNIPTKEMADKLFISVNTVKYHIKNLYDKLEISSRQEAKIKANNIQAI